MGSRARAARSPDSTVLKGLDLPELRLLGHHRRHPLQAVDDLRIHRLLDPRRAVLVEAGDPLLGGHELRASLGVVARTNSTMLAGRPGVPRRQRVALCVRLPRSEKDHRGHEASHPRLLRRLTRLLMKHSPPLFVIHHYPEDANCRLIPSRSSRARGSAGEIVTSCSAKGSARFH